LTYNPGQPAPKRLRVPGTGAKYAVPRGGTFGLMRRYLASSKEARQEEVMGRGLLLWLLGIPLPIILLIWVLGGLHG